MAGLALPVLLGPLPSRLTIGQPWVTPAVPRLSADDGWALIKQDRPAEAESVARDLLARAGAGDSLQAAEAMDLLVRAISDGGKWRDHECLTLARRALEIKERLLGSAHPDLVPSLIALSDLNRMLDNLVDASEFARRALAVATQAFGPDHPLVASAMHEVAECERVKRLDTGASIRLHERALAIREKALGPDHPDVASSLTSLSWRLSGNGDYEAAKRAAARAVAIREKALGPASQRLALSLTTLANLHQVTGDYAAARPLYERAIAIYSGPPVRANLANALVKLALLLSKMGEHRTARSYAERAVGIRKAMLGPSNHMVGRALRDLAIVLSAAGEPEAARPMLERALAIQEGQLGADHPDLAETLDRLARAEFRAGNWMEAFERSLRAEAIARRHFQQTAQALSERQILQFESVRTSGFGIALSALVQAPPEELPRNAIRMIWDEVILSRAMALDELGARQRASRRGETPEIRDLARALAESRRMLARHFVRGPEEGDSGRYVEELRAAQEERERAERALAAASSPFRRQVELSRIGQAEVSAALPPRSALLAYLRYGHSTTQGEGSAEPAYVAFVLLPGAEPAVVPLGPAEPIDALIGAWRRAAGTEPVVHRGRTDRTHRTAGGELRSRIWDPVAKLVGDAGTVFVVPDGGLNLVSLAALPSGDERFLVEDGPVIHYLSAERDLIRRDSPQPLGTGLLAVGGADFDGRMAGDLAGSPVAPQMAHLRGYRVACGSFPSLTFRPLPSSLSEAMEIESLWAQGRRSRAQGDESAILITGSRASEAAFKRMAPGRRVLHLATHGFLLQGPCDSEEATSGASGVEQRLSEVSNPLLMSGLALAGANRRHETRSAGETEDGILFADEIPSLDLSGVEWAVLSACETGLGDVRPGEGVLGLRRAFEIAGAHTLIMSLWRVEDRATRSWMRRLYQARLSGLSTAESLRDASLSILQEQRRMGLSDHPFYWGGFVAAGDWR